MKNHRLLNLKLYTQVLLILLLVCSCKADPKVYSLHFVSKDGKKTSEFKAEVVHTGATRARGLMFRKQLAKDEAMLFIFPKQEIRSFWMKNTYIPLDIIFLDERKNVVSIHANAKPHSQAKIESEKPAIFAVEVIAGRAKELGITAGSSMFVEGVLPAGQ